MPLADVPPSPLKRIWAYILRRQKPIKGAIAFALSWAATQLGLGLDPELAAAISAAAFALVVERVSNWDVVFSPAGAMLAAKKLPVRSASDLAEPIRELELTSAGRTGRR